VDSLDLIFGADLVAMDQVTDMANHLRPVESRNLQARVTRFGNRFPPLFVCVYVGAPTGPGSISDFGLWLLNRARMEAAAAPLGENTRCVLFLVDPLARLAAMQYGYHAEGCLPDGSAEQVLRKEAGALRGGRFGDGVCAGIAEVERILRGRSRGLR
jgi:uncharacterized membrane protein YgcG